MNKQKGGWTIRGVQLDLARQMETPAYIREFIDFAAENRFNTLFLYLEGRVRTASFPYHAPDQSYSPEEMRRIVAHAMRQGMQVIPVVPNLGHTEQFLAQSALAGLAELRDNIMGRFSGGKQMVCPSLADTYSFFARYYAEIADIFPGKYIHVGNDESWDLGHCRLCARRAKAGGLAGIFTAHLLKTHEILRSLGKRMMIWDDMFEVCQGSLPCLPKDVVLCCWLYDNVFEKPPSHIFNRRREDFLARYRALGLEYLVCVRELTAANIVSFTRYARPYRPLGGLVTTWGHQRDFLDPYFPNIAFAGAYWNDPTNEDPDTLYRKTTERLFRFRDPRFSSAVAAMGNRRIWPAFDRPEGFLRGLPEQMELERMWDNEILYETLNACAHNIRGPRARTILAAMLAALMRERLQHSLRRLVPAIYANAIRPAPGQTAALSAGLQSCLGLIQTTARQADRHWRALRGKIRPNLMAAWFRDMRKYFSELAPLLCSRRHNYRALLHFHGFLPDRFTNPYLRILLRMSGSRRWLEVRRGLLKPHFDEQAFYQVTLPLRFKIAAPVRVRVEAWGYGSQGIRFIEIAAESCRFIPHRATRVAGTVRNRDHILHDDRRWTTLGNENVARAFFNPRLRSQKHIIELAFRKEMV